VVYNEQATSLALVPARDAARVTAAASATVDSPVGIEEVAERWPRTRNGLMKVL